MKAKRENPYNRLKRIARQWVFDVENPTTKLMWRYPKEKLNSNWNINDLNERVAAAQQLGFKVYLKHTDKGLEVYYEKERPIIPWELK